MKLLDKLERKYSKFAIHNLMMYIVFANAVVFVLNLASGGNLYYQLYLIPGMVLQGEIWRILTFVMIPPTTSVIFIFFALMFYYFIGSTLEQNWGSFKFTVYYLLGMILLIVSSFLFGTWVGPEYLNLSLFFAFATLFPNYEIRIYFILPVKVKYLAYISAAFMLFQFAFGSIGIKISILVSIGNFLLFFGKDLISRPTNKIRSTSRKQQYAKGLKREEDHRHKCHVCGRTDVTNPELEFRYCSKCEGHYEYCMDHLGDHEHIINESVNE